MEGEDEKEGDGEIKISGKSGEKEWAGCRGGRKRKEIKEEEETEEWGWKGMKA